MEYKELTNSWKKSAENGNLDDALKQIEHQIATNLMEVHNQFCSEKLSSPLDVYVRAIYGRTAYDDVKEKMAIFIEINEEFKETGHGLDIGSTCPKEYVLDAFQEIENSLKKEMARV